MINIIDADRIDSLFTNGRWREVINFVLYNTNNIVLCRTRVHVLCRQVYFNIIIVARLLEIWRHHTLLLFIEHVCADKM